MGKIKTGLTALLVIITFGVQAQRSNSIYSSLGIGDAVPYSFMNQQSMGGVGIGTPSGWTLNGTNPALLNVNKLSTFEFALSTEQRTAYTNDREKKISSGGLEYFALGIPVNDRWTMSLSLKPLLSVDYDVVQYGAPIGDADSVVYYIQGEGEMNRATWSNGFTISENFSVGVNLNYLMGVVARKDNNVLYYNTPVVFEGSDGKDSVGILQLADYQIGYRTRQSYSDFSIGLGAYYSIPLKKKGESIGIGAIYDFKKMVRAKDFSVFERQNLSGVGFPAGNADTLVNNVKTHVELPSRIGIGISYNRINKIRLAADFVTWQWNGIPALNVDDDILRNSMSIAVGAEFIPDFNSVDSYIKRIFYRVGFDYSKTPYRINNQDITDFGINFGLSLPIANMSFLNMAFKYGTRGTTTENLIKEDYYTITIGATFNTNRWMQLPRYN